MMWSCMASTVGPWYAPSLSSKHNALQGHITVLESSILQSSNVYPRQ